LSQVLVISDTHVRTVKELPERLLSSIREAEWVVHCGDYVSMVAVEELRRLARNFVGVYGNADPNEIRHQLPPSVTFELEAKRIAVIHPYWGRHPHGLEEELVAQFPQVDVILFGHTHETCNMRLNGTLLLNPGQGYPSFMVPASIGILTVSRGELRGEILILD
jgi:putative phosphoesterase